MENLNLKEILDFYKKFYGKRSSKQCLFIKYLVKDVGLPYFTDNVSFSTQEDEDFISLDSVHIHYKTSRERFDIAVSMNFYPDGVILSWAAGGLLEYYEIENMGFRSYDSAIMDSLWISERIKKDIEEISRLPIHEVEKYCKARRNK